MEHLGLVGWGRGCKTTAQRWTRLTTALINQGFLPVRIVSGKRRDALTFRGKMSRVPSPLGEADLSSNVGISLLGGGVSIVIVLQMG